MPVLVDKCIHQCELTGLHDIRADRCDVMMGSLYSDFFFCDGFVGEGSEQCANDRRNPE